VPYLTAPVLVNNGQQGQIYDHIYSGAFLSDVRGGQVDILLTKFNPSTESIMPSLQNTAHNEIIRPNLNRQI